MTFFARNFFGIIATEHYSDSWAEWIRTISCSVILMQGGLELDFDGAGIVVILLTLVPMILEGTAAAMVSRWLFELPWPLCFANGFALGAVSLAVLIPSILTLIEKKLGVK